MRITYQPKQHNLLYLMIISGYRITPNDYQVTLLRSNKWLPY